MLNHHIAWVGHYKRHTIPLCDLLVLFFLKRTDSNHSYLPERKSEGNCFDYQTPFLLKFVQLLSICLYISIYITRGMDIIPPTYTC